MQSCFCDNILVIIILVKEEKATSPSLTKIAKDLHGLEQNCPTSIKHYNLLSFCLICFRFFFIVSKPQNFSRGFQNCCIFNKFSWEFLIFNFFSKLANLHNFNGVSKICCPCSFSKTFFNIFSFSFQSTKY
jgi:hypothetical protein